MKQKLVFIGNSIVNGFPLSRSRSFPGLIRSAIRDGMTSLQFDVINKGINGDTTANILRRFREDVLDHHPAAVFILTGTNDFIYREKDADGCMKNLRDMARLAEEAGIRPVFLTPLPVEADKASRMWLSGLGIDYDYVNRQLDLVSSRIRESGWDFVDTGLAWRSFAAGEADLTALPLQEANSLPVCCGDAYLDGIHPTPEGYRFLAGTVLKWVMAHDARLGLQ